MRLQIIGFKFEVVVFSVVLKPWNLVLLLLEDELFEKVWPKELAISGISVISVLFRFRCLMFVAGDFPAILRTIDQTFFIEVRLLILETYVCQEWRLEVLITRLVWARMSL